MDITRGPSDRAQLQRLGKYRLQERVGSSGIGEVWKAFSPQLRRYVAIKILHADLKNDPRFITRFEREAKAIASLHHPNIVQVHDFHVSHTFFITPGRTSIKSDVSRQVLIDRSQENHLLAGQAPWSNGWMPGGESTAASNTTAYLVMDYIDGSTLADYIGKTSRKRIFPSPHEIVSIFASICGAIDYAHSKGIIHGDIKPSNILLDTHALNSKATDIQVAEQADRSDGFMPDIAQNSVGQPILTDFGMTRLLGTPAGTLSRWGLVPPFYLSPKQAMGYVGDVSSDIYSLGVILYEICTGIPPFQGDSPSMIMMQHITATPTPPIQVNPDISPALSMIILRSLDKNPRLRFPSASAMAATLAEALGVPLPNILDTPPLASEQVTLSREQESDLEDRHTPSISSDRDPHCPPTPAFPPAPTPSLLELALGRLRGRQRGVLRDSHLLLLAILILSLIVSSLGTMLVLAHRNPLFTSQQVGHAYFLSSGQLYLNNNQGINDEVLIDLHGIATPHVGKSYYAWLLGDKNASEASWLLLGKVNVHSGKLHFLYNGDVAHTNLLTDMSRFVITEEDANTAPNNPLLDSSTWRYYGEISQTPSPKDRNHFSLLDHIRHLLVQAPELQVLGLQGGLNTWFMRNVEEIAQWALNAEEAWETKNMMLMSHQLINILYYIDGECTSADFAGMPSDTPMTPENATIAQIAHFSLTNSCIQAQQEQANHLQQVFNHIPHDYVDHTLFHLAGVIQSPGVTPAQRVLAVSLNIAVNDVKGWLEQVRQDALQLCHIPDNRLTQLVAFSLLSDMVVHARYAYAGQTDPSTAQVQEGVTWIYDNIQRLASIDVRSYVS